MFIDDDNYEYNNIVKDILENREYKKLENYKHHGINRLEHSKRVSFYSYKICKCFGLDYISASRGGLLHDFFKNNYKKYSRKKLLIEHPTYALYNARKYFKLNEIEKDIIKSHMFPINIKTIPRYKESLIVTIIDKVACIYERYAVCSSNIIFKYSRIFFVCSLIIK